MALPEVLSERYRILRRLGAGGMAEVFLAHDTSLERHVAVKLPGAAGESPTARERLRREALAAAGLDHPFICKVHEIGEDAGRLFIVMEYVAGETLADRLQREGPPPLGEGLALAAELIEALEEAHARNLVHRDLKPSNIMLTTTGHVKVMDFGVVKQIRPAASPAGDQATAAQLTADGTWIGTPEYMSPEQILGDPIDARSDIFSLGVVLWEVVAGVHPFRRPLLAQTLGAILNDTPRAASRAMALAEPVLRVLRSMLAKTPADRYPTLSNVRADLSTCANGARRPQSNLPAPACALVGREREIADLLRLLTRESSRVVTVTGPGGIGKTRVATAAAGAAVDAFPDGVWFVDLTPLRDPTRILPTVAHAAGAEGDLARHFGDSECLLLIDNFEQVVAGAGDLASLVAACPRLRVLVTSREPLHIAAEREYPLRPLPEAHAVELFQQRAAAAASDIDVNPGVAAAICRRLDGLPLAIELAAARVKVFEPDVLLARLEQRLPLLVSRARDVHERQRTLHSTIAWSYEPLAADEQRLFRRLSVFAAGATMEAIETVAQGDADLVESLVDKSLLHRRGERFVMLETIREFAVARLDESAEAEDVRRRHAEFFLAVARSTHLTADGLAAGEPRPDVAIAELDNIRAALGWALARGAVSLGLQIADALENFWVQHDPHEGMRWFAAFLGHPAAAEAPTDVRAHALRSFGGSTHLAGDIEAAGRQWRESLALFETIGDEHGRAVLLHRLGITELLQGNFTLARELVQASHRIHETNRDRRARAWGLAQTTGTLGAIARDMGDPVTARGLVAESATLARDAGVRWWEGGMLAELAAQSLNAGRLDDGEGFARESLAIAETLRDRPGRVFGIGLLANVAAERGQPYRAGCLSGAIEREDAGAPLGGWRHHRRACEARIQHAAGPEFERGRAAGREMSLDEAVNFALGPSSRRSSRP